MNLIPDNFQILSGLYLKDLSTASSNCFSVNGLLKNSYPLFAILLCTYCGIDAPDININGISLRNESLRLPPAAVRLLGHFTLKDGLPSCREGVPFKFEGHPYKFKGHPSCREGLPFNLEGHPSKLKGFPFNLEGAPSSIEGHPSFMRKGPLVMVLASVTNDGHDFIPGGNGELDSWQKNLVIKVNSFIGGTIIPYVLEWKN